MDILRRVRWFLRFAGVSCLLAGLLPYYSRQSARGGGATTEVRLGLPSSPVFRYERVSVDAPDFLSGGYRCEWSIDLFTWSAALVVAGAVLLAVSLRRGERPDEPRIPPSKP